MAEECQFKIYEWRKTIPNLDWIGLKELLKKEYRDPDAINNTWDSVCNIQQKQHTAKETYDHLVKSMNKLVIYGGDSQRLPVEMQIYLYVKGLNKEIRERVWEMIPQPETLEMAKEIA